ncbi:MAG TPA: hypothetical protein PL182_01880 [Pseudobdellovibrionaceae bacterium]|nr:hypothetical protein [Pseudobdellovibrionaceae bacterium]
MEVYARSETVMWALIYFHFAILAIPCVWVSVKVMYEELKNHEISWRIRPAARPVTGFRWA